MEAMKGMRKFLLNKVAQVGDDLKESPGEFILNKLTHLLHLIQDWFSSLLPPPETLRLWAHVGLAVLAAAAALLFLYFFSACVLSVLYCALTTLYRVVVAVFRALLFGLHAAGRCLFCCCRGGGRAAVVMMRAPGRVGVMIPRAVFEAAPRLYFLGLRAGASLAF